MLLARKKSGYLILAIALCVGIGVYCLALRSSHPIIIPAEFEQQEAIVIAYEKLSTNDADNALLEKQRLTLIDIITACHTSVDIKVLVADEESNQSAKAHLVNRNVDFDKISFAHHKFDSLWVRDYIPIQTNTGAKTRRWLDFDYFMPGDSWIDRTGVRHGRSADDKVFIDLAQGQGIEISSVDLVLHGGAVLSNGGKLLVISNAVLDWNQERFSLTHEQTRSRIAQTFPGIDIQYVPGLANEPTQHLDMFMVFTSRDTVVIGRYSQRMDSINHFRLNGVARQMMQHTVDGKPLNVRRVVMPPRGQNIFGGSYTNVVFANGTLLVPDYGIDPDGLAMATALYKRLLPQWTIQPIYCGDLILMEGALHCVTGNIPAWK